MSEQVRPSVLQTPDELRLFLSPETNAMLQDDSLGILKNQTAAAESVRTHVYWRIIGKSVRTHGGDMDDETKVRRVADFGSAVREARKRLGLTQQQTAEFCGISVTYLYQLEKGKETIEFGKAIEVSRRLGIDLFARRR